MGHSKRSRRMRHATCDVRARCAVRFLFTTNERSAAVWKYAAVYVVFKLHSNEMGRFEYAHHTHTHTHNTLRAPACALMAFVHYTYYLSVWWRPRRMCVCVLLIEEMCARAQYAGCNYREFVFGVSAACPETCSLNRQRVRLTTVLCYIRSVARSLTV